MDAKELFETLNQESRMSCADGCHHGTCHSQCGLEVVDELLSAPGAVTGEEVDLLLDFRSLLRARLEAENTLRVFCDLRRRLEQPHYLAFYRLRRWLENQMMAEVRSEAVSKDVRVSLDFYCVEALRRLCLCEAFKRGVPFGSPRLTFAFRPIPPPRWQTTNAGHLALM